MHGFYLLGSVVAAIVFTGLFIFVVYVLLKDLKPIVWIPVTVVLIGGISSIYYFLFFLPSKQNICQDRDRQNSEERFKKPVIYFYSPKEQIVDVHLHYAGTLTVTYPAYDPKFKGWRIKAYPDGKVVDLSDNQEYSYIFWEGENPQMKMDFSRGFVVEGKNTDVFLKQTLSKMGLIPREYNEFIVYWYPILKKNKYNLIYFAQQEYEDIAQLDISPKPDAVLRVFMVYKPLVHPIDVPAQELKPFQRTGFTVVEWGGNQL